MIESKGVGRYIMDLYLILGLTILVAAYLHKKLRYTSEASETEMEPIIKPIIKPFNPQPVPMTIDDDILICKPLTPPGSPMSTSSSDFVMDESYIK